MKAPDKMYFNRPNPEEGGDFFPYWTENAEKADNVISEAYIRKDALLGYAKARLLQYDPDYSSAGRELQMIIDKLNEM